MISLGADARQREQLHATDERKRRDLRAAEQHAEVSRVASAQNNTEEQWTINSASQDVNNGQIHQESVVGRLEQLLVVHGPSHEQVCENSYMRSDQQNQTIGSYKCNFFIVLPCAVHLSPNNGEITSHLQSISG